MYDLAVTSYDIPNIFHFGVIVAITVYNIIRIILNETFLRKYENKCVFFLVTIPKAQSN